MSLYQGKHGREEDQVLSKAIWVCVKVVSSLLMGIKDSSVVLGVGCSSSSSEPLRRDSM